jgi:hypothetical protein
MVKYLLLFASVSSEEERSRFRFLEIVIIISSTSHARRELIEESTNCNQQAMMWSAGSNSLPPARRRI